MMLSMGIALKLIICNTTFGSLLNVLSLVIFIGEEKTYIKKLDEFIKHCHCNLFQLHSFYYKWCI